METNEFIYDNYKESFILVKNAIKDRDRYFIILIITITSLLFIFIEPNETISICKSFIKGNFNVDLTYSVYVIQSVIWFLLLYFSMKYYQKCIYIERQYHYLDKLEDYLKENIHPLLNREGDNYISDYPLFGDFIDFIFKFGFPFLYIFIVILKIINEWASHYDNMSVYLNTFIAIIIVSMTFLYLLFLHSKKLKSLFTKEIVIIDEKAPTD